MLTSTTLSASQLIERQKFNKNNIQHRFLPLDVKFLVNKFINHWEPELVIFVDSEVWPNTCLKYLKEKYLWYY